MCARDTPAKWWVLKTLSETGVTRLSWWPCRIKGRGEMLPMWSIAAAKEFLASKHIAVYNETVARDVSASAEKYFALTDGSKNGVYVGVQNMLAAKRSGGGVHELFVSRDSAQKRCDETANSSKAEFYVVWDGSSTGVMNEAQMLAARCGIESVIEGPMVKRDAQLIWDGKADEVKTPRPSSSSF